MLSTTTPNPYGHQTVSQARDWTGWLTNSHTQSKSAAFVSLATPITPIVSHPNSTLKHRARNTSKHTPPNGRSITLIVSLISDSTAHVKLTVDGRWGVTPLLRYISARSTSGMFDNLEKNKMWRSKGFQSNESYRKISIFCFCIQIAGLRPNCLTDIF